MGNWDDLLSGSQEWFQVPDNGSLADAVEAGKRAAEQMGVPLQQIHFRSEMGTWVGSNDLSSTYAIILSGTVFTLAQALGTWKSGIQVTVTPMEAGEGRVGLDILVQPIVA
jgi:hypothetical protein